VNADRRWGLAAPREERILRRAEFDPKVQTYWLLSGAWILAVSIVGIPLLPFWFAIGRAVTGRYLRHMKCVLAEKTLQVGKGALTRVEKTVPLDQVTDLGLVQGPIMRFLGLEALSVETAGQSSEGALVKLVGIVDSRQFRDAVLTQRDALATAVADVGPPTTAAPAAGHPSSDDILCDIRDTLRRIEHHLAGDDDV
jgi:putative membrane protein